MKAFSSSLLSVWDYLSLLFNFSLLLCDFCVHFDLDVSFCLIFTFFVALGRFNFPWLPYQSLLALSHIQSTKAIFFLFVREWRTVCPSSLYVGFSIPAVGNHSRKFLLISFDPGSQASVVKPSSSLKQKRSVSDLPPAVCFKGDFCSSWDSAFSGKCSHHSWSQVW